MNIRTTIGVFILAACNGARAPSAPSAPVEGDWTYDVDATNSPVVNITAIYRGAQSTRFVMGIEPKSVELLQEGKWVTVAADGDGWTLPACKNLCSIRYTVDFANAPLGFDQSVKSGTKGHAGYLSPSYAFLMHPDPIYYARINVNVHGGSFVSGIKPRMRSTEFGEGSFAAFGELRTRTIALPTATLDVAILGDEKVAMGDDTIELWAGRAGKAVAQLWGRFPVDRCAVFVVPIDGPEEVVFGKVLSLGGPAIATFMGNAMRAEDIPNDWVLVHEMIHLGFPTFLGEGRWLGEGVATYYEPILRGRAGFRDATSVWKGFAHEMPRAKPRGTELALEKRGDIDSIYWGGAFFMLMADVRIRRETHGKKSMDDVMRTVWQKGGDATRVWRVADVLRVGDEVTGTHVLTTLHAELAVNGKAVDPLHELESLGVAESGISNDAPLAWIRKAILE
jgi:hypothetical protein